MASTLLVLAVFLSLFLVVALWWLRRGPEVRSMEEWETRRHKVDMQVLTSLLDLNDERRLRDCLSPRQFRHFQRRRTRLALSILRLMEENVIMLMGLAQSVRTRRDPALTPKADEMIAVAFQLRANLAMARVYLFAKWLFPLWTVSVPNFEPSYRDLLDGVMKFRQHSQGAEA